MADHNQTLLVPHAGLRTAILSYVAFGALWILVSDRVLEAFAIDASAMAVASTLKGWAFVAVSALLLYLVLRRPIKNPDVQYRVSRSLKLPLSLIGLAILVATALAISVQLRHQRETEANRMRSIAEVKTRQIADWLLERHGDAQLLAGDLRISQAYERWRRQADPVAKASLVSLLAHYRNSKDYTALVLVDRSGKTVWDSEGDQPSDGHMRELAVKAMTRGEVMHPPPYRDTTGTLRLDVIAPLGDSDRAPMAAVVLRTSPNVYLFPLLQSWPVPSASGETLLFRQDGDHIAYLNELRHEADAAGRLLMPVATSKLLAAQVLRGDIKPNELFEGEDYRGVPVLGVARAVLGTDWILITKLDRAELFAVAWRDSLWLALAGLLMLALTIIGAVVWRQRIDLLDSLRERRDQADRLHSLELLGNLVRSSDDIIYAKDIAGRYLLFNPAGCRFFGKNENEILGRDVSVLLPPDQVSRIREFDSELRRSNDILTVEERLTVNCGERVLLATKGPLHDATGEVVGTFCIARDITERKLMETELARTATSLKDSLSKAQLMFDSALDAVVGMDQDGRIVAWNASAESLFRYPTEQAMGADLAELIVPPSMRNGHRAGLARFIASGQRHHIGKRLEIQAMRSDGSEFPVELTIGALKDGDNYMFNAYIRDITERKAAELSLIASEQRFRDLVNTTDGIVWEADAESGRFTFVSDQAERLLGYPVAEWLEPAFWVRHIHPDDQEWVPRYCLDSALRIEPYQFEYRFMTADGRTVWLHDKVTVVAQDGKARWLRGIMFDVTERKRSEETIRKLSLAVEQSPESIVITNLRGEIEYVNESFERNTGYARDEVLGRNPRILQSGETPTQTYAAMWESLSKGISWKGEFFNRRKDGSTYVEFAILTPIRQSDGQITHYVAVKEDITEKRRVGRELDEHRHHLEELVARRTAQLEEAREKAESANVAKSAFLANMSHEIRTPMNAIVGLTYILLRTQPTPEQAEKLNKVNEAAEHLLSIINDILDLSKIEAGKLALEHTDFSLSAILDHARSLIAEQAKAKGIELMVDCEGVPPWLRGDPTRLRQALLNYAGNAIKFTKQGTIVLRAVLLSDDDDGVRIRFEVQDTGIGIPTEHISGLFQAFVQADASTTRNYGGTGLGLAISRRLAYMMDGDAGVESEVGKGSTFWFTALLQHGHGIVPLLQSEASKADESAEARLRRRNTGARLLLAEDNAINRDVALELIHAAGLTADTAQTGREAVAKATNIAYDLILMDVQMPQMNGLDATRAIRSLPGHSAVPILAMTANAFNEDRQTCMEAGMNDFIAKPVNPELFYAALMKWLPTPDPAPQTQPVTRVSVLSEEDRRKHLEAIPGLDLAIGLGTMRGNAAKYSRLLCLFAEGYHSHADQIFDFLTAGKIEAIEPVAHSLRGAAGMLGATRVADAASAILEALEGGGSAEEIGRLAASLAENLTLLVDGIHNHAADVLPEGGPAPLPARSEEVLAHLESLLENGDMAASYLARDEAELLTSLLGESVKQLQANIEAFEYEAAAATLRGLRGHSKQAA